MIDHRPHLILPGFIDTHIHYPQMQVIGSYAEDLLEWLNTYTFVEEQRFADPEHAERIAGLFLRRVDPPRHDHRGGLLHGPSAIGRGVFRRGRQAQHADGRGQGDDGSQRARRRCATRAQSGYDDTKALIAKWHGQGRLHYAITPRFALTSTPEQMEMAEALAREYPEAYIQTHVNESLGEIDVRQGALSQLGRLCGHLRALPAAGAEDAARPLHPHDSTARSRCCAETGSVAVFCPTSNLFIGSGLFDRDAHARGVCGSGWPPMSAAARAIRCCGRSTRATRCCSSGASGSRPLESFYMMTLGNARALSLEDTHRFARAGRGADLVVLDARAMPQMALRMERVETLGEELFLLQTCGDDRVVVETYVAGEAAQVEAGASCPDQRKAGRCR